LRVPLPPQRYQEKARRVAFFEEVLPKMRAVPGVAAVGLNTGLHPLGNMTLPVDVSGEPPNTEPVLVHHVNADYVNALGIRLASGRLLTDSDVTAAQQVALVNERFANTRLVKREALGQMVRIPRLAQPPVSLQNDAVQIVGVVHDTLNSGLTDPPMPEIYLPYTLAGMSNQVIVRADGDPASITRSVVGQVYAVDSGQPVTSVQTMDALLKDAEYATPRFNLILLTVFASVGLVLAVVGVYGVMSSAVAQERQEIGIRMALGAESGTIARMVVMRGTRLLVVGTVVGLIGSYAAGRYLAGSVWNVAAFDPLAFGAVSAILLAAGLQACFWPARRAARIDPIIALRQDT
jgi:predicted permease